MREKRPMNKWFKRLIIFLVIAVLTVLFGSLVFYFGSYITLGFKYLFGFLTTAMRWLAKVLDFFHFTGIFGG